MKKEKVLGKPSPASTVVNSEPKVLLIGYGWVGQYCGKYFTKADIYTEDGLFDRDGEEIREERKYDFAIISVPTPMAEDGSCDTSIVEEVVKKWADNVEVFMIKSTVAVGTSERLMKKYKTRIVMSPEYIGETLGHPLLEPRRDMFLIIGGEKEDRELVAKHWKRVLHAESQFYFVDAKTAELCKYMENSFLATKVMFCNEFFSIAKSYGINYEELREIWLADPRITRSHTFVYEDNRGFSGKCLPKDLHSLVYGARNQGSKAHLIEFLLTRNADMRKNVEHDDTLLPEKGPLSKKQN